MSLFNFKDTISVLPAGPMKRRRSDQQRDLETEEEIVEYVDRLCRKIQGQKHSFEIFNPDTSESMMIKEAVVLPRHSPDPRVAKWAGLCVSEYLKDTQTKNSLRVSVSDIIAGGLLHDVGKYGRCQPLLAAMQNVNIRDEKDPESREWKIPLLRTIQREHVDDGVQILEQLAVQYPELQRHRPFLDTVIKTHGHGYTENLVAGRWWSLEVNIITLADDYDACTSSGIERSYRPRQTPEQALEQLRIGMEGGRFERRVFEIFEKLVLTRRLGEN